MTGERHRSEDVASTVFSSPESRLNRRGLLGDAVGGLVLAASGLFVPQWLEESEAREGAFGGRLGGRHGRNRRGRNRPPRRENNSNANDAPRGAGSLEGPHLRWIKIHLYNDLATPNQSASIEPWVQTERDGWGKFPNSTLANGKTATFPFRSAYRAGLNIDGQFYVEARNFLVGTPQVVLAHGGQMTRNGYEREQGRPFVRGLSEGEETQRLMGGRRFTVKRITDSKDYIEFDVHFS
ncbi:MAG: hypothetical protein U0031_19760 [Thermomicrobiales bacterium]